MTTRVDISRPSSARHRAPRIALLTALLLMLVPATAGAAIISHGAATATYPSNSTTILTAAAPAGAQPGDVLIASLGFGRTGSGNPVLSAPAGWTLIKSQHDGSRLFLFVYRHVLQPAESTYSFTTNITVGGTVIVNAYGGVDPSNPVDSANIKMTKGQKVDAPGLTTRAANEMLVASYAGMTNATAVTSWTAPAGMTEDGDVGVASHSGAVDETVQPTAGNTGTKTAIASLKQDSAAGALTALRPAASPPPPPSGQVPLIVDTDIFSSADDVGALATAFGLQLKGAAKVIAVNVNTGWGRDVATNSWKCVAAITNFYGFPSVPIGAHMPDNGTAVNTLDFTGPCAQLAPANTPAPDTAVNVYRRALASQPDGSVVIASIGYKGNLVDLLKSPPDAISPLSGRDLVARKVRMLVAMGGGYPTSTYENNVAGDPASAQYVAANWPTTIVWSGVEVGDNVQTGSTISSVHPTSSPVRVAYEAFVGPNKWIYSYDLTGVYHAIRPTDGSLVEMGPGTNAINNVGGNVFTFGAGQQYYLKLTNPTALDASIEGLLDTIPAPPPPPPPPPPPSGLNDNFDSNTLDPATWTIDQNGSDVAAANGELEITHPGGSDWTTGDVVSVQPVDLTKGSVQVQVVRPANNGNGGSTYGESSVMLRVDSTHYAEFFFAGGALTAFVNTGSGESNLTPSWPRYDNTAMQWVRFRVDSGTLYFEYAASASGPWTTLASTPYPFTSVPVYRLVAGSNVATDDVARFDNVATIASSQSQTSPTASPSTAASPAVAPSTSLTPTPSADDCDARFSGSGPTGPETQTDLAIDAACLAGDNP